MKNEKISDYYVGLDIGTDSVGYAVTNTDYSICKHKGNPMCGVTLFDETEKCDERRKFRSARRRLDRRQQRVLLVQELFANEIGKIDKNFFVKIKESALFLEDKTVSLSNDEWLISEYQKKYPTIHHLIYEIMISDKKYDIRLIYLACAWLVAHRGHFLNDIDGENTEKLTDMNPIYAEFIQWFVDNGYAIPWECDAQAFKSIISKNGRISDKEKEFYTLAFDGKKPADDAEEYPFSKSAMVKLLCGGTVKVEKLFISDEFECVSDGSITLSKPDELEEIIGGLGENAELLIRMSKLYDCAVLSKILSGETSISKVKIKEYNQHKDDLKKLKYIVKKYCKDKYDELFRSNKGYSSYVANFKSLSKEAGEKSNKEDFYKEVKSILGNINAEDEEDNRLICDIIKRIESGTYMPKQVNSDNRVIPQQLYYAELKTILENASKYYDFFVEKDESGISIAEKIKSVFKFKIPYFVGPLNSKSQFSWIKKSEDKIYPWNFEQVVDFDKSEAAFIKRMTNQCSYLPGEAVLPKNSILYEKYIVLNEINNLKIDSRPIPVEVKQDIFNSLFMPNGSNKPKVTAKAIMDWFISKGYINKNEKNRISGIDIEIKSSMKSYFDFYRLINNGTLSVDDAENIIEHSTYTESKQRMKKWLINEYSLSKEDIEYLSNKRYKDFGRLSKMLLNGLEGVSKTTGEIGTVMYFLWNTNDNLMQIIADNDKYNFKEQIENANYEYYCNNPKSLNDRLNDMQISNGVKRPIFRTLEIVSDIVKVKKCPPKKIFIEMARGATDEQKNRRTKSRKDSLMEIYKSAQTDEAKRMIDELSKLGDDVDDKLKSERLYLYFAQLGKCMYCGKKIVLDSLFTEEYDVDHIWPQAYIKDDSVHNNKVLVHKTENGIKSDKYPLPSKWQSNMHMIWQSLHGIGLINDEKYKRLTRTTQFTVEEKSGFINRQLVETRQSTKAVAELLNDIYKETEIVYVKAKLASEFRHEYGNIKSKAYKLNLSNEQKKQEELAKCRSINDIHHAYDAYLNIVVGNVYTTRFAKKWFNIKEDTYSLNCATLFGNPLKFATDVWNPTEHLPIIDKVMANQHIHLTKFQTEKKGGFFDQQPKKAGSGVLIPLKNGMSTEKYGGYNKPAATFFVLVKYQNGNKNELSVLPIDLLVGNKFKSDEKFAKEWLQKVLGKKAKNIELPLKNRILKVNTVFSLDGFEVCLSGKANGGARISFRSLETCYYSKKHVAYMKKIEKVNEKLIQNPKYTVTEKYDGITEENNTEIFEYMAGKINSKFYEKLPGASFKITDKQREIFSKLSVDKQIKCMANMALYLKTNRAGTCDMTTLDGKKGTGSIYLSANISNWKYDDIRIIDRSASGLYETKSINLKELL